MSSTPATAMPEPLAVVHTQTAFRNNPPKRHIHREHIISILLNGKGSYRTGACDLPLGRPIAVVVPSGDDDINGLVGPGESWYAAFEWPAVSFESDGSRELKLHAFGKSVDVPRYKRLAGTDVSRIVQQFTRMKTAFERQDLAGAILARALLAELLATYLEFPDDDSVFVGHRALVRFCELLQARCCEQDSIEALSAKAGFTADHLRELFRARFGVGPLEYRTGLRLARARDLLASTTLNVKEVAHRVGFSNPLYFSRVFRKRFGITPQDTIRRFRLP